MNRGKKFVVTADRYAGVRPALLKVLRCPLCIKDSRPENSERGDLQIADLRSGTTEAIQTGTLRCLTCSCAFEIDRGIPKMIHTDLNPDLKTAKEPFRCTRQSFLSSLDHWSTRCREYFAPFDPTRLGRSSVLDAGCGYGRWLAALAPGKGLCVAMDSSDAVFACADFLRDRANCHVVQGDILHPPFKPQTFEVVYSIGALPNIPQDAGSAVGALTTLIAPGGLFFAWMKGKHRPDRGSGLRSLAGEIAARIPLGMLRLLCFAGAAAISAFCLTPKRLSLRSGRLGRLAGRLPFEGRRDRSFSDLRSDLFDHFATPLEHGYDAGEIREMLAGQGLEGIEVAPAARPLKAQPSWRGWGFQPGSTSCRSTYWGLEPKTSPSDT